LRSHCTTTEDEELPDFVSVAEELLLDVELQLNINIDRAYTT